MFFYLLIFLWSTICMHLAYKNHMKPKIKWTFLAASIFLPALIAGARDATIGTDLDLYGIPFFNYAKNSYSYLELIRNWKTKEYGFITICYISSRISGDVHLCLFIVETFKLCLVYYTIWYFRKRIHPAVTVMLWMIFMYNFGLSAIRQTLAISICIFSIPFLFRLEYKSFIAVIILAYTFHNSALLFLIFPFLLFCETKIKSKYIYITTIVGGVLLYSLGITLLYLIAASGIVRDDFLDNYIDSGGVNSAKTLVLLGSFITISSFLIRNKIPQRRNYLVVANVCLGIISVIFCLLCVVISTGFRMAFYQLTVTIFTYPTMLRSLKKRSLKKGLLYCLIILFFLNFIISARHSASETIPYASNILG